MATRRYNGQASGREHKDEARKIEEILIRPPPTQEQAQELEAAAREFYRSAMKQKHEREKRQFLVSVVLVTVLAAVWYLLTRNPDQASRETPSSRQS